MPWWRIEINWKETTYENYSMRKQLKKMEKTVLWESENITRKKMAGLFKWKVMSSLLATKLCQLNSFRNLCENGIEIDVTQEEERTRPNYVKIVKRFVYLLAKVGNNNNNNNNNNNYKNFSLFKQKQQCIPKM